MEPSKLAALPPKAVGTSEGASEIDALLTLPPSPSPVAFLEDLEALEAEAPKPSMLAASTFEAVGTSEGASEIDARFTVA